MGDLDLNVETIYDAIKLTNNCKEKLDVLSLVLNAINISGVTLNTASLLDSAKSTVKSIINDTLVDVSERLEKTKNVIIANDASAALYFALLDGQLSDEFANYDGEKIYSLEEVKTWLSIYSYIQDMTNTEIEKLTGFEYSFKQNTDLIYQYAGLVIDPNSGLLCTPDAYSNFLASNQDYKGLSLEEYTILYNTEFSKYMETNYGQSLGYGEYKDKLNTLYSDSQTLGEALYSLRQDEKYLEFVEEYPISDEDVYVSSGNLEVKLTQRPGSVRETDVMLVLTLNGKELTNEELSKLNPLEVLEVLKNSPNSKYFSADNNILKDYDFYEHLTDEQINNYNSYYAKYGREVADSYFESIEDKINAQVGLNEAMTAIEDAKNKKGNISETEMFSTAFGDGVSFFLEGIDNLGDADGVKSSTQYKQLYIMQYLANNEPDKFSQLCYEFGFTVGNMAPSMAVSMALGPAGATAASLAGQTAMGLSVLGNSRNEGLIAGGTESQAWSYGALTSLSEVTLGTMLGNIPFLNPGASLTITDIFSEGVEEALQEFVGAGFQSMVLGTPVNVSQLEGDALKSFLFGCLLSMGSNAATTSVKTAGEYINGERSLNINGKTFDLSDPNDLVAAIKELGVEKPVNKTKIDLRWRDPLEGVPRFDTENIENNFIDISLEEDSLFAFDEETAKRLGLVSPLDLINEKSNAQTVEVSKQDVSGMPLFESMKDIVDVGSVVETVSTLTGDGVVEQNDSFVDKDINDEYVLKEGESISSRVGLQFFGGKPSVTSSVKDTTVTNTSGMPLFGQNNSSFDTNLTDGTPVIEMKEFDTTNTGKNIVVNLDDSGSTMPLFNSYDMEQNTVTIDGFVREMPSLVSDSDSLKNIEVVGSPTVESELSEMPLFESMKDIVDVGSAVETVSALTGDGEVEQNDSFVDANLNDEYVLGENERLLGKIGFQYFGGKTNTTSQSVNVNTKGLSFFDRVKLKSGYVIDENTPEYLRNNVDMIMGSLNNVKNKADIVNIIRNANLEVLSNEQLMEVLMVNINKGGNLSYLPKCVISNSDFIMFFFNNFNSYRYNNINDIISRFNYGVLSDTELETVIKIVEEQTDYIFDYYVPFGFDRSSTIFMRTIRNGDEGQIDSLIYSNINLSILSPLEVDEFINKLKEINFKITDDVSNDMIRTNVDLILKNIKSDCCINMELQNILLSMLNKGKINDMQMRIIIDYIFNNNYFYRLNIDMVKYIVDNYSNNVDYMKKLVNSFPSNLITGELSDILKKVLENISNKVKLMNVYNQNNSKFSVVVPVNSNGFIEFSRDDYELALKQMIMYFGDLGPPIKHALQEVESISQLFEILEGKREYELLDELQSFGITTQVLQEFLDTTKQGMFLKKLNPSQLFALTSYTRTFDYEYYSDPLRKFKGNLDEITGEIEIFHKNYSIQEIIKNIDSALELFGGLEDNMMLFRGTDVSSFYEVGSVGSMLKFLPDKKDIDAIATILSNMVGEPFKDYAYLSTSPSYTTSYARHEDYPIAMIIEAPAGTRGAYINQVADYCNDENEFLLVRGTELLIKDVFIDTDFKGNRKVYVKCSILSQQNN